MIITLYMAYNPFIYTILLGLSESYKITFFKDLLRKIFKAKVAKNGIFFSFFRYFDLKYLQDKIFE